MRRTGLFLVLGLFLLVGCVSLLRWGRARAVAVLPGALATAPVGEDRTLLWIERDAKGDRLVLQRGRGAPRSLLSGASLGGLALFRDQAFTTEQGTEGAARLLAVNTRTGAQHAVATLAAPARTLATDGTWIAGVSRVEAAVPGVSFVVAAGASTALWAVPRAGGTPVSLGQSLGGAGEEVALLGLVSGQLYWVAWRPRSGEETTTISRSRLPDGQAETVASEEGRQSAALLSDRLAWTCPSPEADSPTQFCGVKVQPLGGGEARVVADWLPSGTQLVASGTRLYAHAPGVLWQLGGARGDQRVLRTTSGSCQFPVAVDGIEYAAEAGRQTRLLARGLSWPRTLQLSLGL